MADVVSAVRSYLLSKTAVSDIIGQRLYLDRRPQKCTLPAATLTKISEMHAHGLSDRAGFVQTRMQMSCYSALRLTSNALAAAMYKSGIAAVKGVTHSVNIRGVTVEEGQRNYTIDNQGEGIDDHTYVTDFDLLVSYRE